uniref:Uncharacterized protein n=1 Tax=Nelumbo nucifera TaxID=4432 RepID=A0A822YLG7_NELNU|nr:TPA_asm: hypothetical protein HUJ06_005664 [Nelumbo nucifera]
MLSTISMDSDNEKLSSITSDGKTSSSSASVSSSQSVELSSSSSSQATFAGGRHRLYGSLGGGGLSARRPLFSMSLSILGDLSHENGILLLISRAIPRGSAFASASMEPAAIRRLVDRSGALKFKLWP